MFCQVPSPKCQTKSVAKSTHKVFCESAQPKVPKVLWKCPPQSTQSVVNVSTQSIQSVVKAPTQSTQSVVKVLNQSAQSVMVQLSDVEVWVETSTKLLPNFYLTFLTKTKKLTN